MSHERLQPLRYEDWEPTKTTLHLWTQIVGKVRMACTAHRNHWWNITLVPSVRGLTTLRMRQAERFFEIELDLIAHQCVIRSAGAESVSFALHDGLSVASFYQALVDRLRSLGIDTDIVARPYGVPMTTPFAEDSEHRSYEPEMARRWFGILLWTSNVFDEFAAEFVGKQSPPHLFWHSFDLAMGRYSGRPASGPKKSDPVQQEAYSREVIAFGFWPGDAAVPAASFYTYAAPEPESLSKYPLVEGAAWYPSGAGHLGVLPYELVRQSTDPREALLAFLRAGYAAAATSAAWDMPSFRSEFA